LDFVIHLSFGFWHFQDEALMTNIKAQMSNEVQSSNEKEIIALSFGFCHSLVFWIWSFGIFRMTNASEI
jgi:hypothetical protein